MMELFSLIDTMWPPAAPLKAPGHGPAFKETTHLPPPSFCYILTAHPNLGQIDAIEEDSISKLYQPPIPRFLREILQTDGPCTRCSFYARVIYQRPQVNSLLLEPREMWLVVTDVTLQTQDEGSGLPRTVPVRVAPSCVLGQEVRDTLSEATSQSFFFRDALRDQGPIPKSTADKTPVMATRTEPEPPACGAGTAAGDAGGHSRVVCWGITLDRCRSHLKPLPGASLFKTNKKLEHLNACFCPSVSTPLWTPRPAGAQVPSVKWWYLHMSCAHPPTFFF
ncbi:DNA repair-scaffolding protein-like isoform X2 [Physeter macrocephalus]|uniref:DNA repair-scaffolding protein-like isoform X2 n=1 Tax=Physeter macrocephalus TaxID=9755 RepID=A0A455AZW3_PHYMC|nr:DNA repair-scaffolding protein-like isoform X2 [Physeter catodon]|eukprot:XP_028342195.1 DNA repair-scaffolding protein-like isoform X2 [Physeter catodon]